MSTLGQPHPEPAWKREVARRLAAHKNRKGSPEQQQPAAQQHYGNSFAAQAAARVAQRYAKAPSYSQMQAEEARLAVRAAEIATQVALEAQAVAQDAIAELHAAAEAPLRPSAVVESIRRVPVEPADEPAVEATGHEIAIAVAPGVSYEIAIEEPVVQIATAPIAEPQPQPVFTEQVMDGRSFGIRWEPDTPVRVLHPRPTPSAEPFEVETEDWWTPAQVRATLRNEPFAVETEPPHANLIEFPRELVATRRMRPRLAEPVTAATQERQLSIFEVDPGAVSTEPEPVQDAAPAWSEPAASSATWSDSNWSADALPAAARAARELSGPEWSGIELDEHPATDTAVEAEPSRSTQSIHLAPIGYRLMATAVDACLILGVFFAGAVMVAGRMSQPPALHTTESLIALGLFLVGFAYHSLFCTLGFSTPGMRYAGIALCTFDDESPTRAQFRRRLGAMALSLLPMGFGLAWAVFDEDHLSWHDRMSQTYLRRR